MQRGDVYGAVTGAITGAIAFQDRVGPEGRAGRSQPAVAKSFELASRIRWARCDPVQGAAGGSRWHHRREDDRPIHGKKLSGLQCGKRWRIPPVNADDRRRQFAAKLSRANLTLAIARGCQGVPRATRCGLIAQISSSAVSSRRGRGRTLVGIGVTMSARSATGTISHLERSGSGRSQW
jgi:hypothetical protein